jgi:homoserine dehydrogenase
VCRDPTRVRDFTVDPRTLVTSSAEAVLDDPSVNMVVEVMGGTELARRVLLRSAAAGRHVVTANKALLAAHLPQVEAAFPRGARQRLGYEAAVAGGIPIIRTLASALALDQPTAVSGILNGTTNFMLSAMAERTGVEYATVLAEAQAAGFAEADPTADVEGHDARNKLVLLARLALGASLPVESVRCAGITGVTPADFALARGVGCTIKLVGRAARAGGAGGHGVEALVSPALVPATGALGSTGGALNLVSVDSEYLGRSEYRGAGAGRFPTALSVVADMVNIALGQQASVPFPRALLPGAVVSDDVTTPSMARVTVPARGEAAGVAAATAVLQARGFVVTRAVHGVEGAGAAGGRVAVALLLAPAPLRSVEAALQEGAARGAAFADVAVYPMYE